MLHILIIPTEIPSVENLMVADQCTTIRASWDITEGPCTDLLYNVTLLSSNGEILREPSITNGTFDEFDTVIGTFNGNVYVRVVPMNDNTTGTPATHSSVIGMS